MVPFGLDVFMLNFVAGEECVEGLICFQQKIILAAREPEKAQLRVRLFGRSEKLFERLFRVTDRAAHAADPRELIEVRETNAERLTAAH
jgi:hypothetical protein